MLATARPTCSVELPLAIANGDALPTGAALLPAGTAGADDDACAEVGAACDAGGGAAEGLVVAPVFVLELQAVSTSAAAVPARTPTWRRASF